MGSMTPDLFWDISFGKEGKSSSDVYRDLSQEPLPSVGQVMDVLAQFDCDK